MEAVTIQICLFLSRSSQLTADMIPDMPSFQDDVKVLSKAELNSAFAPIMESFSFSEPFLNLKSSKKEANYIHFFFHFSYLPMSPTPPTKYFTLFFLFE